MSEVLDIGTLPWEKEHLATTLPEVIMASTFAYSTSSQGAVVIRNDLKAGLQFESEPDLYDESDPCLGSNGVISTSACCRIAEQLTGATCPLCSL